MNNERRDADALEVKFEEVQVGDRVRTRQVFEDGTVVETEFVVEYVNGYCDYFGNSYINIHKEASERESLDISLVSRPPKVGDLLTGEQVQRLPDLAVFLSYRGRPLTVFKGLAYSPVFTADPLSYYGSAEPTYRLIYLPEEEN